MRRNNQSIRWKFIQGVNTWEGYVNGSKDYRFSVQGSLCVCDLKNSRESETWIPVDNYRISNPQEGKEIAMDLLCGDNLDKHEANRLKCIAEQDRTTKLIADADALIKSLRDGKVNS